jgi:hypothetical protein
MQRFNQIPQRYFPNQPSITHLSRNGHEKLLSASLMRPSFFYSIIAVSDSPMMEVPLADYPYDPQVLLNIYRYVIAPLQSLIQVYLTIRSRCQSCTESGPYQFSSSTWWGNLLQFVYRLQSQFTLAGQIGHCKVTSEILRLVTQLTLPSILVGLKLKFLFVKQESESSSLRFSF